MTGATHRGDLFASPRARRSLGAARLRSRALAIQALALPAAVGVLALLLEGHGLSWLAGLAAGASTTAWLTVRRAGAEAGAGAALAGSEVADQGDGGTREEMALLHAAGWRSVHDVDARFGRYGHIAVGPGGVLLLESRRLVSPQLATPSVAAAAALDPGAGRELTLLRRRALRAAANLREELEAITGSPTWVQPVVVVWSDFPAGCVQDGRCVLISGPRLADWLRRRPGQLSDTRAEEVLAAVRSLAPPIAV